MDNGIQQYGEAICNKNKQNQKVLEVKKKKKMESIVEEEKERR